MNPEDDLTPDGLPDPFSKSGDDAMRSIPLPRDQYGLSPSSISPVDGDDWVIYNDRMMHDRREGVTQ